MKKNKKEKAPRVEIKQEHFDQERSNRLKYKIERTKSILEFLESGESDNVIFIGETFNQVSDNKNRYGIV